MLGVSCDEDNLVIAFKIKYSDTASRKIMLDGFEELVEEDAEKDAAEAEASDKAEKEAEADSEQEEAAADEGLEMPDEFEDSMLITSADLILRGFADNN